MSTEKMNQITWSLAYLGLFQGLYIVFRVVLTQYLNQVPIELDYSKSTAAPVPFFHLSFFGFSTMDSESLVLQFHKRMREVLQNSVEFL